MSSKLIGSSKVETTSTEETELVTYRGENGTFTTPSPFYSFSISVMTDALVNVNGGTDVFLPANSSLTFRKEELKITSFKIKGTGIKYVWVATV